MIPSKLDGKYKTFKDIIEEVIRHKSEQYQLDLADIEWIAAEARALGLLNTESDAELLTETISEYSIAPMTELAEEITPVLRYPESLDSKSNYRLKQLILMDGSLTVAKAIGISENSLSMLTRGNNRGPLFRHFSVPEDVVRKARNHVRSEFALH